MHGLSVTDGQTKDRQMNDCLLTVLCCSGYHSLFENTE